jgi:hypothetical protein
VTCAFGRPYKAKVGGSSPSAPTSFPAGTIKEGEPYQMDDLRALQRELFVLQDRGGRGLRRFELIDVRDRRRDRLRVE